MASISSLGVGSGLDAESIITKLMAVEHQPIDQLATKAKDINTQLSSIGKLQSLTTTMSDSAAALSGIDVWGKKSFTSSDATVVTGSVVTGTASGSYGITVQQLSQRQTVTTTSPTPTLSEGTLTIELGSWNGPPATAFTPKSGATAKTITIDPAKTSLTAVRDQINAAGAGVTATVINDANGARLSLTSTNAGAANGFRITASEAVDDGDDDTGLSALAFDATATSATMQLNQRAQNAKATMNGIALEAESNTFTDVVAGLTVTVGKVSATPVQVEIADDNSAIKSGVQDFVKAFNELANYIREQTKYNATAKSGAPLQGDRTTIGFQLQLRGVINEGSSASSAWSRLSEVGITMKTDGTLAINNTKLETALKTPAELRKLLATDGSNTANSGFMDRFRDLGKRVLDVDGSLQTREDALNAELKRNTDRQATMEQRLTGVEARLRAQYQALDDSMAKLNGLSSYVSQQMSLLSK